MPELAARAAPSAAAGAPILSAADHEHFLEHGFIVLKALVPGEIVARVRAKVDESFAKRREQPIDWTPTLMPCLDAHLRGAVAALMPGGEEPELVSLTLQSRAHEPGAAWSMRPTHVDGDYPTLMPNFLTVAALVFLTPARRMGGALVCYPGSHRRYRGVMGRSFSAPKDDVADPTLLRRAHQLEAEAGDVVIFHHLFAHAGSANVRVAWTRHAALAWWRARQRIVPGARRFSRMSTVEKANSARYLERRFGAERPLPSARLDDATAKAFACGTPATGVRAHALLQFGGRALRFVVGEASPARVGLQVSRDLRTWRSATLQLPARDDLGPIASTALFQWGADIVAVVGQARGARICSSRDLADWKELALRPGSSVCSVPHVNRGRNATRFAEGCVLLHVPATDRRRLWCAWGPSWHDLSTGSRIAASAPAGTSFEDAAIAPVLGEFLFGLVADVKTSIGSRPMVALSDDSAAYPALQPLRHLTPTVPRRIRVYARAENYWMVSYIRRARGRERFFWGTIDWTMAPALTEIRTVKALRQAFFVLGIR